MTTNEPRQRPETVTILGETRRIGWHSTLTDAVPFTRESIIFEILEERAQDTSDTDLSGWDYRVVKLKGGDYAVLEVYFDENERPYATADATPRGHDLAGLAHDLAAMVEALGKPVLDEAEIEANAAAWLERTEAEIAEGRVTPWEEVKAKHGLGDS